MKRKYNIFTIRAGTVNIYVISNGDNAILVDGGNAGKINTIINKLSKIGILPINIDLIILTHTHFDHVGSLNELQMLTPAKILVHESEAENLSSGYTSIPKGTNLISKLISDLGNRFTPGLSKFKPIRPNIIMSKEYDLTGFGYEGKVIHTPGHSEGSISVILEDEIAFVGDTLVGTFPTSIYPPFADDPEELIHSWEKLYHIDCKKFYPGHGKAIEKEKFTSSYLKYKNRYLIKAS